MDELNKEVGPGRRISGLQCYSFPESEIKIIPLGDVHYGDQACDIDLFKGELDYIKKSGSYVIAMGDLINNATLKSVSDTYNDKISPHEQYDGMVEYLSPIKKQILGMVTGNHEERTKKETGIDLTKMLAGKLGVPYLGYAGFYKIKVGDFNYSIYTTHGASGASTPEGKMRAIRKLSESFDADVYCAGHTHDLSLQTDEIRRINYKDKIIDRDKKYYVNTGHFLNYDNTYAEMKQYKPGKKGVAKIKLFGKRKDVHVTLWWRFDEYG